MDGRLGCVDAELFLIPRVPTSREIDQAVSNAQAGIKAFYDGNRDFLTRRPGPSRDVCSYPIEMPRKDRATKEILEALRQRVIDGEDMEKLVNEHGFPRDRRTGGRRPSHKKVPSSLICPSVM